jgi:hypothetical protein
MIIETPYKVGDTISFKTVAGEEVIARLVEEKGNKIKITKPMALTATQQGLGLVPFTFTVSPDANIEINLDTVVFVAKTDKEMASQYVQQTTGLTVV